jgi:hypothetical protein
MDCSRTLNRLWNRRLIANSYWLIAIGFKLDWAANCQLLTVNLHSMARIKIDLHDIYNNSAAIDRALQQAFDDAVTKKIREVEIIPGKGSGQLRKKVERFLQQPHIKPLYHRIENDSKNFGRLFVYFKF